MISESKENGNNNNVSSKSYNMRKKILDKDYKALRRSLWDLIFTPEH